MTTDAKTEIAAAVRFEGADKTALLFCLRIDQYRSFSCDRSFDWGRDDCLMWLANIYKQVLGADPAEAYRGRYTTKRGAYRVLGPAGVAGALEQAADEMGWPEIEPADAIAGDLGMVETQEGPAGAIFDGRFWIGRLEYGFSAVQTPFIDRAWGANPCRR